MGGEEVDNKLVDQVLTNESLLEKIRRHLASADFRKDVRSPGKVRRKQYTVDEAHSPLASHVQYHSDFEGQGYYLIRNIRFYRIVFNELKDDSKDEVTENKMSKIVFSLNSLPIVTVDMAGTQSDLAVKLPLHNATVEV